jgi:hypothetical protein
VSSTIHAELTGKETASEFEKLLDLAEELKDRCEKTEQQLNKLKPVHINLLCFQGFQGFTGSTEKVSLRLPEAEGKKASKTGRFQAGNYAHSSNKLVIFLIFAVVLIIVSGVLAIDYIAKGVFSTGNTNQIYIVSICLFIISLGVPIFFRIIKSSNKLKRNFELDRKALKEVIGLLREVESVETKSPLERAYFRIKLSRFDIGS